MSHQEPHDEAVPRDRHPHVRADDGTSVEVADALWVQRVEDQVRTLKGVAALLGALAVVAVAVAVYALITAHDDGDEGRSASADQVARLDERVDRLEDDVEQAAAQGDNSELRADLGKKANQDQVDALKSQVDELQATIDADDDSGQAQDISELQGRVDTLAQQVEALSAGEGP